MIIANIYITTLFYYTFCIPFILSWLWFFIGKMIQAFLPERFVPLFFLPQLSCTFLFTLITEHGSTKRCPKVRIPDIFFLISIVSSSLIFLDNQINHPASVVNTFFAYHFWLTVLTSSSMILLLCLLVKAILTLKVF
jgi:hypothetical protein